MSDYKVMVRDACNYKVPEWVEIRKIATAEDFEAFCAIKLDSFGDTPKSRKLLLKYEKEHYRRSYVWLYKGEYIGIFTLHEEEALRVTENTNFRVLYNFVIIPKMREKGFGRLLLQAVLSETCNLSCQELMLKVDIENEAAVKLYTQAGFTLVDKDVTQV